MTPQERFDYKQKWLTNSPIQVMISNDLKWDAKDWVRNQGIPQHAYEYREHTAPYMDTWLFENMNEALRFSKEFAYGR